MREDDLKIILAHYEAIYTLLEPLIDNQYKGLNPDQIRVIISNWDRVRNLKCN
jgi:hypothetical protein